VSESARLPETLRSLVKSIDTPVSSDEIDTYARLRDVEDRSHRVRTILDAWSNQQTHDRNMRQRYASWLAWIMSAQLLVLNVVFVLIGTGTLKLQEWTVNLFVISVFGEIVGLTIIVVKYLFPTTSDKLLDLLRHLQE
jgi:hypothetical protein